MAKATKYLKVVNGEFGHRDNGEIYHVSPIGDPPKQHPAIGAPPERVLRNPMSIGIDPTFQRNISHKGKMLIRSMVQEWSWYAFIPPAIYPDERTGQEMAYDGQHTLIGAASRDDIELLPCDLHATLEDAMMAAAAFLDRNTKRIGVAPLQRYKSAIAAQRPWALELKRMSAKVGFHIPYYPSVKTKPDTVLSVATLRRLLDERGEAGLERIMKILVGNAISPIREMHLLAVDLLLNSAEYKKLVRIDRLGSTLRGVQNHIAIGDAQSEALKRGMTRHQCLANIYLREYQGVHGVR